MAEDDQSEQPTEKTCFFVCPIGSPATPERIQSDWIYEEVVKPAAEDFGYRVIRADEIAAPGNITDQVIDRLMRDSLVIADLTGKNANVFYEVGIRHRQEQPIIHMIQDGESLPFDITNFRTLHYDISEVHKKRTAFENLKQQMSEITESDNISETPVSRVLKKREMRQQANDVEKNILDDIDGLKQKVKFIEQKIEQSHNSDKSISGRIDQTLPKATSGGKGKVTFTKRYKVTIRGDSQINLEEARRIFEKTINDAEIPLRFAHIYEIDGANNSFLIEVSSDRLEWFQFFEFIFSEGSEFFMEPYDS